MFLILEQDTDSQCSAHFLSKREEPEKAYHTRSPKTHHGLHMGVEIPGSEGRSFPKSVETTYVTFLSAADIQGSVFSEDP